MKKQLIIVCLLLNGAFDTRCQTAGVPIQKLSASSSAVGFSPRGASDGDRFALDDHHLWRGTPGKSNWWWQADFASPVAVGALLQIVGDHDLVFRNAPRDYVWQFTRDGTNWTELPNTRVQDDHRLYRIFRFDRSRSVRGLRMSIQAANGNAPVLREVEFYPATNSVIAFPDWILAVNCTQDGTLPGHGREFIPLARSVTAGAELPAQQVWLDTFNPEFVAIEPRPLAAFLSGTFKDWCLVNRELWRGTGEVLKEANLPMWASCGGAQGLAILAETGVDHPWDCPHCRDPKQPLLPIYTHVGHLGAPAACGDYSNCIFERGPHEVVRLSDDPAFAGLPDRFNVMESHCGQIEWPPKGWSLIATAGKDTLTKTQCLKVDGRPIYAAQFHIEMDGTPETSRVIMANFLRLAKAWDQRK